MGFTALIGRRGMIAVVFLGVVAALGLAPGAAPVGSNAAPNLSVRLIVDFNDGAQKQYSALAWTKGMTVLDAMNLAKAHAHGIAYVYTGSGPTAFLTEIDGTKNEGGGAGKKNWLYWVNTEMGDVGFGAKEISPSDVVLWKFDVWSGDAKGAGQEKK